MSDRPIVMVTETIDPAGIERLGEFARVVVPAKPEEAEICEMAMDVDALLVRVAPVTTRVIDASPKLRHIQKHGVGVDNIDVEHATARGIAVSVTPEANSAAVAEHAVATALAVSKRLAAQDKVVRDGHWRPEMTDAVHELVGRTVGVVGGGRVGRRVANALVHGFGMRGLVFDPYLAQDDLGGEDLELVPSLPALLNQADVVSLHVPLTPATRHLIDAEALRAMRSTAVLVNTCRGAVVDEAALADALHERRIAGAAIDVFEQEPPLTSSPLRVAPNLLMSPHFAGLTVESSRRMALHSAEEIWRVLGGKQARWCQNLPATAGTD